MTELPGQDGDAGDGGRCPCQHQTGLPVLVTAFLIVFYVLVLGAVPDLVRQGKSCQTPAGRRRATLGVVGWPSPAFPWMEWDQ